MDPGSYCRAVESYLCRKNDGHLIRVVGPAFDLVCGWASRGIPLRVVYGGIDRRFERYHATGARRRPLRIEFCEADVLEGFDIWRRAVGVGTADRVLSRSTPRGRGRTTLADHVTRVADRLARWLEAGAVPTVATAVVARLVEACNEMVPVARTARGAARRELVERLAAQEQQLTDELQAAVEPALLKRLRADAAQDLATFRERMPADRFQQALAAATRQHLRTHLRVPQIRFE